MLARTDSRIRAVVMLVVASIVAGVIGYRLVWWQVIDRERLADMGLAQVAHDDAEWALDGPSAIDVEPLTEADQPAWDLRLHGRATAA